MRSKNAKQLTLDSHTDSMIEDFGKAIEENCEATPSERSQTTAGFELAGSSMRAPTGFFHPDF